MAQVGRRGFIKGAGAAGLALGSSVAAPFVSSIARAQEVWPNRPVKFVVPLAPGGAIDFIARAVGE